MENVEQMIGGKPKDVIAELKEFSESARVFSSNEGKFLEKYPQKWIAVIKGEVVKIDETLDGVLKKLKDGGFDCKSAIIRFIDKDEQNMIL